MSSRIDTKETIPFIRIQIQHDDGERNPNFIVERRSKHFKHANIAVIQLLHSRDDTRKSKQFNTLYISTCLLGRNFS